LGQEDSAKAAFSQFLDDLILIEVVIVVLILPDILLMKVEACPSKEQTSRFVSSRRTTLAASLAVESLSHGQRIFFGINSEHFSHPGACSRNIAIKIACSATQFLLSDFALVDGGLLVGV
jgi:hypothetical protein